jgi:hypothetical protein
MSRPCNECPYDRHRYFHKCTYPYEKRKTKNAHYTTCNTFTKISKIYINVSGTDHIPAQLPDDVDYEFTKNCISKVREPQLNIRLFTHSDMLRHVGFDGCCCTLYLSTSCAYIRCSLFLILFSIVSSIITVCTYNQFPLRNRCATSQHSEKYHFRRCLQKAKICWIGSKWDSDLYLENV